MLFVDDLIPRLAPLVDRMPSVRTWICTDYYRSSPSTFHDGWLRTGDMAVMERDGYFRIVDRSKDLVKSGGEWISSVELAGEVLAHPAVREVPKTSVGKYDKKAIRARLGDRVLP